MNQDIRKCARCEERFELEPDDLGFYEKLGVPPPTFCPLCRKQRRLAWRNDMNLYSRTCGLCGKNIVSIYSPDSDRTVYCVKCWWSDGWDPKSYAQDYDFSRPFFEQFRELQRKVPTLSLINDDGLIGGSVNCEYNQDFARAKNCYMVFIAWKIEDCMYSYYLVGGRSVVDSLFILEDNDSVYESIFTEKCYRTRYTYYSANLSECAFCYDCRDSSECFMCVGLRHKKYCFKNEQYTKEEYEKILAGYRLDTYAGLERAKAEFRDFLATNPKPRRFAVLRNTVNSTGDSLSNCKNARDCFFVQRGEECRFVEGSDTVKDSYDLSTGGELSLAYEGITPDHTYMGRFGIFAWKNTDYFYLDGCHSSEHVFGCAGLKKGQYCILNKQYTKEEYEALVPRVIEHMNAMPYVDRSGVPHRFGEFYPAELSYFGYNESVAQDWFPLSREEADERGLSWREKIQFTTGKETVKAADLPETIGEVKDSILDEVLGCVECGRNYRIILRELEFYRRMNLPLPRRCFYCRHRTRMNLRNPNRLWRRKCQCAGADSDGKEYANTVPHAHGTDRCPVEFQTSYAPDRPEIVYCDSCYQSEVS